MIAGFDWLVFGFCFLSIVLGVWRGMVKEIGSLFTWVGSLLLAWYVAPLLGNMIEPYVANGTISYIISLLFTFFIFFIISSILWRFIHIPNNSLLFVDKLFGLFFGVARGIFIMSLVYIIIVWMFQTSLPESVHKAISLPFISGVSDSMVKALPLVDEYTNKNWFDILMNLKQLPLIQSDAPHYSYWSDIKNMVNEWDMQSLWNDGVTYWKQSTNIISEVYDWTSRMVQQIFLTIKENF